MCLQSGASRRLPVRPSLTAFAVATGVRFVSWVSDIPASAQPTIRLSLAGTQSKLAVLISNARLSVPLGDAPSTHILKLASMRYDGLTENEVFCIDLAKAVGLRAAKATLGQRRRCAIPSDRAL